MGDAYLGVEEASSAYGSVVPTPYPWFVGTIAGTLLLWARLRGLSWSLCIGINFCQVCWATFNFLKAINHSSWLEVPSEQQVPVSPWVSPALTEPALWFPTGRTKADMGVPIYCFAGGTCSGF